MSSLRSQIQEFNFHNQRQNPTKKPHHPKTKITIRLDRSFSGIYSASLVMLQNIIAKTKPIKLLAIMLWIYCHKYLWHEAQ
jgi:hypothetical protein